MKKNEPTINDYLLEPDKNSVKTIIYTVSQKIKQNYVCHNFVNFPTILIIFGKKMTKSLKLYEVHSFSTSKIIKSWWKFDEVMTKEFCLVFWDMV